MAQILAQTAALPHVWATRPKLDKLGINSGRAREMA
jgi:hypothetical protein